MSKQKRWWVSRDKGDGGFYNIHHRVKQPRSCNGDYLFTTVTLLLRGQEFRRIFELRLQKGECKEIERPMLVLK